MHFEKSKKYLFLTIYLGSSNYLYYYFDHSTKRKGKLQDYACLCRCYILQNIGVNHWLRLQMSVEHIPRMSICSPTSYFLSQDGKTSDHHLYHLQALFSGPITEIDLMLYQSTLPVFTKINLLLQKDYHVMWWKPVKVAIRKTCDTAADYHKTNPS